ncbi:MAG TPA: universal stress protein [Candidatus Bathyarchaeia archaeon]|nr:universal stress protein [Candidatus Bathyarchaeia archaeon]
MTKEAKHLGKILLYIHGDESSMIAAKCAIAVAKKYDCLLTAISVVNESLLTELLSAKILVPVEKMDFERALEEDGRRYLDYVVKLGEQKGLAVETKLCKGIVHSIVADEVALGGYDLLIQGELGEVLSLRDAFHQEGERILRSVGCPVLIVRGKERVDRMFDEA